MGRTIGVIEARMASPRLPGQILAPLAGRPLLSLLWARIRAARVDEWWLLTGADPTDDVTEAWGFELGLRVFRGDRADALSGFIAIGSESRAEWIVRVRADQPFVDARLVDATLDARDADEDAKDKDLIRLRGGLAAPVASEGDPTAPHESPRLPLGYEAEALRLAALRLADATLTPDDPFRRGPTTAWLGHPAVAPTRIGERPTPPDWPDRPEWRWTIDSYEDLAMARSAFRLFEPEAETIDYPGLVARLDEHPEIAQMNRRLEPDAGDRSPRDRSARGSSE